MRSFWRVLLVWLTVLAIPVQGVAAARMTHCLATPASMQQHGSHGPREALDSPDQHDAHHRHHQRHQQGHHDHHAMTGDAYIVPQAHPAEAAAVDTKATTVAVVDTERTADADATPETPAASPKDGKAAGVEKKCSACAACCAAAVPPTHVAEVPRLDLLSTPASLIEAPSVSFIASGPERPPRTHLA